MLQDDSKASQDTLGGPRHTITSYGKLVVDRGIMTVCDMGKTRHLDEFEEASRARFLRLVERQQQKEKQAENIQNLQKRLQNHKPFSYNKSYLYGKFYCFLTK